MRILLDILSNTCSDNE